MLTLKPIGNLKRIEDLRTIWKHEEHNFSQWLFQEENLKILAETLNIEILNPKCEVKVGGFELDIQAETEEGKIILIENQLEQTNHDHLGKLITYGSGIDAGYIIWIVKKAREEHRQAVDWLNENTNEDLNFFLLEIVVEQIDDSNPAVRFEIVARPNNWAKSVKTSANQNLQKRHYIRYEFWQKFIDTTSFVNNRSSSYGHWFTVKSGYSDFQINLVTSKQAGNKGAAVELEIRGLENFKRAETLKYEIESILNLPTVWVERTDSGIFYVQLDFNINNEDKWSEIFDFYRKFYVKMKDQVVPLLKSKF